jgi:hypothetical protein
MIDIAYMKKLNPTPILQDRSPFINVKASPVAWLIAHPDASTTTVNVSIFDPVSLILVIVPIPRHESLSAAAY